MILVTGHKGFIGKYVTEKLDQCGLDWVGYDLQEGKDIRNNYDLECAFELNQVSHVIHMAALAGVRRSVLYPKEYIDTNITGTSNIVEMCNRHNVEKLVFFSSSSVYGDGSEPPVLEKDHKSPISLYGITKLAGEHIVNTANCSTVIVRPFTVYGENGRADEVIYKWLMQLKEGKPITVYGDGSTYRGYVYVKDLVDMVVKIVSADSIIGHEDFNLGGSEIIYLRDIIGVFDEVFGEVEKDVMDLPSIDIFGNSADITKARNYLGFDPKPCFLDNIRKILKSSL